ncbi:MAG: hypothetical protein HC831_11790 [Chloroflexia bacterium]|nr:hypothetical protein [Chloroflexia bacterium]
MKFEPLKSWVVEKGQEEKSAKSEITFNDIFGVKNKWVPIAKNEREILADKFRQLVDHAYEPVGGHLKVNSTADILRDDWDVWYANDVDEDPDADVVFFGKRTPFGVKLIGAGHDGSRNARRESMLKRGHFLLGKGAYMESSHQPYMILSNKYNVNIIKDPKIVQAVLNKPIQWHGKHPEGKVGDPYDKPYWYTRQIGGVPKTKILLGNPILDALIKK